MGIEVSIPFRYAENFDEFWAQYPKKRFQFLLGTLKTRRQFFEEGYANMSFNSF